jgi:hypothetical protein
MILQMRGPFPFDEDRCILIPRKEDVQRAFLSCNLKIITTVQSVFRERNYNHIRGPVKSINHLLEEEEVFVLFGSIDQAMCALSLVGGITVPIPRGGCVSNCSFRFLVHPLDIDVRAKYRTTGDLLKSLRDVDQRLRLIGAVPSQLGFPELSSSLVHNDEFDSLVHAMQEDRLKKKDLHLFLVSQIRVDKIKREAELDHLVEKRIHLLISLQGIDKDIYPFSCELQYTV